MDFNQWVQYAHTLGAVATVWPFSDDGHMGEPAARFDVLTYTAVFNAGHLPTGAGTRTAGNGEFVYVLASSMTGNDAVSATAPHTMTAGERFENAAFSTMDNAADAVGLPALSSFESAIKDIGKSILIGIAVTAGVTYFMRKR